AERRRRGLLRALLLCRAGLAGTRGGGGRLSDAVPRRHLARERVRDPVSPGKEPARGADHAQEFRGTVILFSRESRNETSAPIHDCSRRSRTRPWLLTGRSFGAACGNVAPKGRP